MARWNYTIDLQPEWDQAKDDVLAIKDLIPVIDARFKASLPEHLYADVQPLLDELKGLTLMEEIQHGDDVDADEFDEVWSEIYGWADANRVWIKTLF